MVMADTHHFWSLGIIAVKDKATLKKKLEQKGVVQIDEDHGTVLLYNSRKNSHLATILTPIIRRMAAAFGDKPLTKKHVVEAIREYTQSADADHVFNEIYDLPSNTVYSMDDHGNWENPEEIQKGKFYFHSDFYQGRNCHPPTKEQWIPLKGSPVMDNQMLVAQGAYMVLAIMGKLRSEHQRIIWLLADKDGFLRSDKNIVTEDMAANLDMAETMLDQCVTRANGMTGPEVLEALTRTTMRVAKQQINYGMPLSECLMDEINRQDAI